jgi:hypothetical protein
MKKIYKYELTSQDCTLKLPKGAEILTVKLQNTTPTLWALVDPEAELEARHICIVGTGWDVEDNMKYITTYIDGYFVWHIFELIK